MEKYFTFALVSLLLPAISFGCKNKDEKQTDQHINYLKAYEIPIPEPSGLDLTISRDGFWIVSDENSKIYKLDKWGKVVKSIKINGNDLEGISVLDETSLAVVLERSREILIIDTSGKELKRKAIDIKGEENNGLEGITYDPGKKRFYVLNEKNPVLLLTLDKDLNQLSKDTLKFLKDASGICFEHKGKLLWVLSDESRMFVRCDLKGNPLQKYYIAVVQPEGIAADPESGKIYLVSDSYNTLYVYEFN